MVGWKRWHNAPILREGGKKGLVFPRGGESGRKRVVARRQKRNRREIRNVGREQKLFASLQCFNVSTAAFGKCVPLLQKSCKSGKARRVPLSSRAIYYHFYRRLRGERLLTRILESGNRKGSIGKRTRMLISWRPLFTIFTRGFNTL